MEDRLCYPLARKDVSVIFKILTLITAMASASAENAAESCALDGSSASTAESSAPPPEQTQPLTVLGMGRFFFF